MKSTAIVITGGLLDTIHAKTAHGLIRGTERFEIVGIIDSKFAGTDAGLVVEGNAKGIPVFASIADAVKVLPDLPKYCVVGVATKGGVIPATLRNVLREALEAGIGIVNGLHQYVSDIDELAFLAREKRVEVLDVRKPKPVQDLHFWTGAIKEVKCPKVPVLGTDCALGKRTAARLLVQMLKEYGYKAEMIYTGQTGWMQGFNYGFIFDATLNDFVSGELEHAIVSCWREERPDILFVEGQSSLRNPSGPAGAEWLLSADADGVVLVYSPTRTAYKGLESYPAKLPHPREEIELIRMYGVETRAIILNTMGMKKTELDNAMTSLEHELQLPVIAPLEYGTLRLLPIFEEMIQKTREG